MPPPGESPDVTPWGMIIAIVLLFLVIISAGALFYQSQEEQIQNSVISELSSIAHLKVNQIAQWRGERLGDAAVLSQNQILIDGVRDYLSSPDPAKEEKILRLFAQINASYHYHNVQFVDREGRVKVSLDPADTVTGPELGRHLADSLATRHATLTDIVAATDDRSPQMYAIAPLITTDNGKSDVVGGLILTIDPAMDLYPLIQSWPVPSESSETLLVERQGDHVLYLNELRHEQHTALNLTFPLTQTDLPAVRAVLGTTGAFIGHDYRGIEVLSVLEPVPGSPWFMVAKVDAAEAFSSWRSRAALIIALIVGTLAGALVIAGLVWQRRQKYYYRSLYDAETARREEEGRNRDRLETLLRLSEMTSARDQELADFVLDAGCRLTGSHLSFTGIILDDEKIIEISAWSRSLMEDVSVAASPVRLPLENAGTWADSVRKRQPVVVNDYHAPQTGGDGFPLGHVPITRFASIPILDEQRAVMVCVVANKESDYTPLDVDNLMLLMQGVWNHFRKRKADEALREKTADLEAANEEITATDEELRANYDEIARAQQALKESERRYRNLYQYAQVGLFETSFVDATIVACNQRYADLAGFVSVEDALGKDILQLYANPEDREEVDRLLREQGYIENRTLKLRNRSTGKIFWGQFSARFNFEREVAEGSIIDITVQKDTEESLRESEERYRLILDTMQDAYFRADSSGIITMANPAAAAMYGYPSAGMMIGVPVVSLYANREDRDAMFRQLDSSGRISDYTGMGRRKDGSLFWVSINVRVTNDSAGKIQASEGFVRDITARKHDEENLRASETRLAMALEVGNAGIWEWNIETDEVRFDPGFHLLLGYAPGELPHTLGEWMPYHNPEDVPVWMAKAEAFLRGETPMYESEHRIRAKDGSWAWVFTRGQFINSPAHGPKTLFVGIAMNVTGRRRAEEAIRASEKKLRGLLDSTPFPVAIVDAIDNNILYWSRSATEKFGHTAPTVAEWYNLAYPDSEYRQDVVNRWKPFLETARMSGQPVNTGEYRITCRDGSVRICELYAMFQVDSLIVTFNDITDRKLADEALQQSEEHHRRLFETMIQGVVYQDSSGNIISMNPAAEQILGKTREEFLGESSVSVEHDTIREDGSLFPGAEHPAMVALSTGQDVRDVVMGVYNPRMKMYRWIRISAVPVFRPGEDRPYQVYAIFDDITERRKAEEELRETNDYLQNLLNYANAPMIVWDPDFRITRFNPAFERLSGRLWEDVVGQRLDILFPESSREVSLDLIRKTLAGERWEVVEIPIRHISGDVRIVLWNSANIVDPRGTIISTIAQGQDITGRKMAEEALKESEREFRTLAESMPQIVWITRPDGWNIYFNHQWVEYTGLTLEESYGHGWITPFHPDDKKRASDAWERATQHNDTYSLECRLRRVDGAYRWWLIRGEPLRNAQGEILKWFGTCTDIDGIKQAEDALRQSEEKYRVLFTRMVEGSAVHEIVYEPDGKPVDYRILDVNPAFESVIGIRKQEIIGKTSREAYGVDTPPYLDVYARVAETGQPEGFEVYFAPMQKHFAISVYSPRKGRFATIFEDITDRKKAEELRERLITELEQKNAELERFTYTVSHDLKSPLITIRGFAGLVEADVAAGDPVQLKKDVQRIMSAADIMQELLADVLELSRIGRVVSPPEKISFGTIVHEAVELLAGPLAERGVTVEVDPALPVVRVDHARIREVMVNLIENAVKFMGDQQKPAIRIGVETGEEGPVFFVQDNGIGINPRYLERVFNLFERLDVSTHGTGIGLTIVRRIIEVHGGKIWAESEGPGKGTTFRFTLPDVSTGLLHSAGKSE